MKNKTLTLFLVLLLIWGCEYSPIETNFVSIIPPENNIDIVVLNPNSISELRDEVTFYIQTKLDGHPVISIIGYLDDREVPLTLVNSNRVKFQTDYYPDGEYTFTIFLFTSTGSGSLADRLEQEVFYAKNEYPVTLFNAPIKTPSITDFSIVDGALSINWEKYEQLSFKKYELKKNGSIIATISDVNQTSYRDTSYIGEVVGYELVTYVLDRSLSSSSRWHSPPTPSFASTTLQPDGKLLITWNKCPFTHAFGKYVIYGLKEKTEVYSVSDTTIVDELPRLGAGGHYALKVFSKSGVKAQGRATTDGPPIGTPFELNEQDIFKYIPEKNIFVRFSYSNITSLDSILYYDGDNLTLKNALQLNYDWVSSKTVSDNGNYIYIKADNTYKINSNTLQLEESIDLMALMPTGDYYYTNPIHGISVANNNFLATIIKTKDRNMRLDIFDLNEKKWIDGILINYWSDIGKVNISGNGKFITFSNRVYEFNGDKIRYVGKTRYSNITFTKDNNSLISYESDRIKVLNCSDLQIENEIYGHFSSNISVDPKSGLVGIGGKIFDPLTGSQRGFIRLNNHGLYQNGYYFCEGYYKYVELY